MRNYLSRATQRIAVLLCMFILLSSQQVLASVQESLQAGDTAVPAHKPKTNDGGLYSQELVSKALEILRPLESSVDPLTDRNARGIANQLKSQLLSLLPRIYIRGPSPHANEYSKHKGAASRMNLVEGVESLAEAEELGNPDAMFILAEMSFYGNYSYERNMTEALYRFSKLAAHNANGSAHHMLGFMHATSVGYATPRDAAKALLHHTFAARAGHTRSEMTLAYRYSSGIGVAPNCEEALYYYRIVAEKAIRWYKAGPPGGRHWPQRTIRLADEHGGVYGEGASVSSAGFNARQRGNGYEGSVDDMLDYLDVMATKGDIKSILHLGLLKYDGQRGVDRDLVAARKYFQSVAQQYWRRDGTIIEAKDKPIVEKYAGRAAGYLGHMYLRAEGVKENHEKALEWFRRGMSIGDSASQFGMGLMCLHGLGIERNALQASEYFRAAAQQNHLLAQVEIGLLHLDQGLTEDVLIAQRYFEIAARQGNIEARYYLGEMANSNLDGERSCELAVSYYKRVAEQAEPLLSSLGEASDAYLKGNHDLALLGFMMAAEQGYEVAQMNAAYLLDHQKSLIELPTLALTSSPKSALMENNALALLYWTRSAKQNNIDSLVKMGDYYLNGIGTPLDPEKAAICYTAAADFSQSAQALFNLGWMHENGIGMNQDFHLSKRFYDQALWTNAEAYMPVKLSLLKLRARSAWNTLTRGSVNSIHDEPGQPKKWSWSEWITNFLEEDRKYYEYDDAENGHHISQTSTTTQNGEDDGMYDDILLDDGVLESFLIIALVAALIWLVYYRQQRQLAQDGNNQNGANGGNNQGQPGAGVNGGLFPAPADPDFPIWAAGGVGH